MLAKREGVVFIPPHLAEELVVNAEQTQLRDIFGKARLAEGVYTPGQVDRQWSEEMDADFNEWLEANAADTERCGAARLPPWRSRAAGAADLLSALQAGRARGDRAGVCGAAARGRPRGGGCLYGLDAPERRHQPRPARLATVSALVGRGRSC